MGNRFFILSKDKFISTNKEDSLHNNNLNEIIEKISEPDKDKVFYPEDIFKMIQTKTKNKYGTENIEKREVINEKGVKEEIVTIHKKKIN